MRCNNAPLVFRTAERLVPAEPWLTAVVDAASPLPAFTLLIVMALSATLERSIAPAESWLTAVIAAASPLPALSLTIVMPGAVVLVGPFFFFFTCTTTPIATSETPSAQSRKMDGT